MVFKDVFKRFVDCSPVSVMARATLENIFAPDKMEALFHRTAEKQYTRELWFSTVVDLMSLVVCREHGSVHAAYQKKQEDVAVSINALYKKLNRLELRVSQELVRYTAQQIGKLIRHMKGTRAPLLPGYHVLILDGNHLAGTEHRLKVLRRTGAGALPGQALVLLDPQLMLIVDVFPCEDGHAQERSYLHEVLPSIVPKDLIIDDRNFCTTQFLFGIWRRKAFFLTRQHARNLYWRTVGKRKYMGSTSRGRIYQQWAVLTDPETGEELRVRRITIVLKKPTRDGDKELHLLTNVPVKDADALTMATVYLRRWTLETAFQEMTVHLKCELNTLGYPKAALFGFCVALACYNLLAAVKGALCAVHGETKLQKDISTFYLTDEISRVYHGMMIAIPPVEWQIFQTMTTPQLSRVLLQLARYLKLNAFQKHPRGPKKPQPPKTKAKNQHVSTAKLLAEAREKSKINA